jgi:hypothetical protein
MGAQRSGGVSFPGYFTLPNLERETLREAETHLAVAKVDPAVWMVASNVLVSATPFPLDQGKPGRVVAKLLAVENCRYPSGAQRDQKKNI